MAPNTLSKISLTGVGFRETEKIQNDKNKFLEEFTIDILW